MSEGLESLHHPRIELAKIDISAEGKQDIAYMPFYKTKQYAAIEKELKALELIKVKQIDVLYIAMFPDSLEKYNKHVSFIGNNVWCLTQEEFDLLREVVL